MVPSFQLLFFKGDTPTLVVDLLDFKGVIDLTNVAVKLFIQDFLIDADINLNNQAAFFILKKISQKLRPGLHKAWILFTTEDTKYSFYGYFKIERARQ